MDFVMLRVIKAVETPDHRVTVHVRSIHNETKQLQLSCTREQFKAGLIKYHDDGEMIQQAFDFLTANEREFMMTGLYPEEFDRTVRI